MRSKLVVLCSLLLLSLGGVGAVLSSEAAADAGGDDPVLVELFTSQGCSSCPPAERLFTKLAQRDDLVAITWHVDVWNDLIHGGSRWEDPFSSREFTERQSLYNHALRGTYGVYTPQAVIQGARHVTGSNAPAIAADVVELRRSNVDLTVEQQGDAIVIEVSGKGQGRVIQVDLLPDHTTSVTGGENKGRVLAGRNVVLSMTELGAWSGGKMEFSAMPPAAGFSCAIIIQSGTAQKLGPVLAARYCPTG